MKINFNVPVIDLEGKEVSGLEMNKFLATQLASSNEGDAGKMIEWCYDLMKGEVLDLTKSDQTFLVNFVNNSKAMTNLMKHNILQVIYTTQDKFKDEEDKPTSPKKRK